MKLPTYSRLSLNAEIRLSIHRPGLPLGPNTHTGYNGNFPKV
jgi:hypothetical protein